MKIYRVERYDGSGPFNSSCAESMNGHLPEPCYDPGFPGGFQVDQSLIFGCRNKRLMQKWIKYPRTLSLHGFVVNEYTVPKSKVVSGTYQSLFSYDDATFVKKHNIVSFKKGEYLKTLWSNLFQINALDI